MEGAAFSNVTVFHCTDADPNAVAADYTAVVTLGDGNQLTLTATPGGNGQIVANAQGGFDVQLSYTYAEELSGRTFSVALSGVNGDSLRAAVSNFSVADAALNLAAQNFEAIAGSPLSNVPLATLTDAAGSYSQAGDLSASINWGDDTDGSPDVTAATLVEQGASGVYEVEGSHTYAASGSFTIAVSAADAGGSTAGAAATVTVGNAVATWANAAGHANWNDAAAWVGGVLPVSASVVVFPSATTVVTPNLTADASVAGITIDNSGADYSITQSGTRTLTVGPGGISVGSPAKHPRRHDHDQPEPDSRRRSDLHRRRRYRRQHPDDRGRHRRQLQSDHGGQRKREPQRGHNHGRRGPACRRDGNRHPGRDQPVWRRHVDWRRHAGR